MLNKKEIKYIALLVSTVLAFILIEVFAPKPIDWRVTLSKKDKIPFGTYVLHELLPDFTDQQDVLHSHNTLYELQHQISVNQNIFILSNNFSLDKIDTEVLLNKVDSGATAFIAANYFSGELADTLNLKVYDHLGNFELNDLNINDTTKFHLTNSLLVDLPPFEYRKDHFHTHFSSFDSTTTSVILQNEQDQVLGIKISHGKGTIFLTTTPLAFTNNYLLAKKNNEAVAGLLSYLPKQPILWTEYYHLGRMESDNQLRFILKTPPLRWAYYTLLVTLLLFLVFETKRRQRIIPVIKPYANTTLEFAGVIGNLYLQKNDHHKIAEKRIAFFLEQIRQTYFIKKVEFDEVFYETLASKSGNDLKDVKAIFEVIQKINQQSKTTAEDLQELSYKIDQFN